MKKRGFILYSLAWLLLANTVVHAQRNWDHIREDNIIWKDSITRKKYTLVFINKDSAFDNKLKKRMVDAFFKVYPKEAKLYNRTAPDKVIFIIDPEYDGVAATAGRIVRYNPGWFHKNPGDVDVVTHEVMHIVQSYPGGAGPGWITEGIADYVRYTLGVDNAGAHWSLPAYNAKQHYNNAYRVTARFFVWLEKNAQKGIVKKLDNAMRTKTYTAELWKEWTGKTVDEWWAVYATNPAI